MQSLIGDTEDLKTRKTGLEAERNSVGERLQDMFDQNARVAMNQEVYTARFDELSMKYEKADKGVKKVEQSILQKEMRLRQIADTIQTIEDMPEMVTEFSPELWATLVEKVTVYGKGDIRFTLANGAEVRA